MPPSPARVLHVSSIVLLVLLAGTSAGAGNANTTASNATLTATTGSSGSATAAGWKWDGETYICYLCTGRNLLLMRWCPIYWDQCHANCRSPQSATAAAATSPAAATRSPIPAGTLGDEELCYVMKLYQNSSFVIVARMDCITVGRCSLSCGGGDVVGGKGLGAAPVPPASTHQGKLLPRDDSDFQRCGSQDMARASTRRTVPGGAHA